jgi:hypothetical protein
MIVQTDNLVYRWIDGTLPPGWVLETDATPDATPAGKEQEHEAAFRLLAEQWRRETGMHSSITRKVRHPAYQRIIQMGAPAVPLILQELRDRPGYWFAALRAITGQTPVQAADRADPSRARQAWLKWGKEQGLVE